MAAGNIQPINGGCTRRRGGHPRLWKTRSNGRIRAWATVFGLFTLCTDELFTGIKKLADKYGVGTNFHMASSIGEAQALEARTGVWPITQLERLGALGSNVLLTHAVTVRDEEVDLLVRYGVKVAHCPGAALRLAKGAGRLAKIPEMLARAYRYRWGPMASAHLARSIIRDFCSSSRASSRTRAWMPR